MMAVKGNNQPIKEKNQKNAIVVKKAGFNTYKQQEISNVQWGTKLFGPQDTMRFGGTG